MDGVTSLLLRFPRSACIAQQLFFRHRLSRSGGKLRDHLCVIRQPSQVTLRQTSSALPLLYGRRSVAEPFSDRREANKSNRACNTAHWCESVHRKWKVSRDLKCKGSGADSAGAGRHPHNEFLGATAGGEPRSRPPMRTIRYRARARCLAECCAKMAGRRRLTSAEEPHYAGRTSWRQYRMAEDWARAEIR